MGAVYDQFILFGDSLTQQAWGQYQSPDGQGGEGFVAGAALQNGELFFCFGLSLFSSIEVLC